VIFILEWITVERNPWKNGGRKNEKKRPLPKNMFFTLLDDSNSRAACMELGRFRENHGKRLEKWFRGGG
jgi:hypothetical protein